MDTGTASSGMMEARQVCRKTMTTSTTRMTASISVLCTALAVGTALEHVAAESLGRLQPPALFDGQQLGRALRPGLRAQLPGRDLDVLLADGGSHLGRRELARGPLVRVQPHAHGVVARAVEIGRAHV